MLAGKLKDTTIWSYIADNTKSDAEYRVSTGYCSYQREVYCSARLLVQFCREEGQASRYIASLSFPIMSVLELDN